MSMPNALTLLPIVGRSPIAFTVPTRGAKSLTENRYLVVALRGKGFGPLPPFAPKGLTFYRGLSLPLCWFWHHQPVNDANERLFRHSLNSLLKALLQHLFCARKLVRG